MNIFASHWWLGFFSLIVLLFSLARIIRRQHKWPLADEITKALVAGAGLLTAMTNINVAVPQLFGIIGIASMGIFLVREYINKGLPLHAVQLAHIGIDLGFLGGISTKMMVVGGGLPYLCHILADLLLVAGAVALYIKSNQLDDNAPAP